MFDSLPKSNLVYNPFQKKLDDVVINSELFKFHLRQSAQVYEALGPVGCNVYWHCAARNADDIFPAKDKALPAELGKSATLNPSESLLHGIVDVIMPPAPSVLEVGRSDVSDKFTSLVQVIKSCAPYGTAFRAIVFGKIHTLWPSMFQ